MGHLPFGQAFRPQGGGKLVATHGDAQAGGLAYSRPRPRGDGPTAPRPWGLSGLHSCFGGLDIHHWLPISAKKGSIVHERMENKPKDEEIRGYWGL